MLFSCHYCTKHLHLFTCSVCSIDRHYPLLKGKRNLFNYNILENMSSLASVLGYLKRFFAICCFRSLFPVDFMVSRIGQKWSNSNGAIGLFRDTIKSTAVATGVEKCKPVFLSWRRFRGPLNVKSLNSPFNALWSILVISISLTSTLKCHA